MEKLFPAFEANKRKIGTPGWQPTKKADTLCVIQVKKQPLYPQRNVDRGRVVRSNDGGGGAGKDYDKSENLFSIEQCHAPFLI